MDKELFKSIAIAMCKADGVDPESQVSGGPNTFAEQAKDFNGYALCVMGPAWQTYRRQARLFIAASAALAGEKKDD